MKKLLAISLLVFAFACDQEEPQPASIETCDGNPQGAYLPLAVGNKWIGSAPGNDNEKTVVGTEVINTNTYYKMSAKNVTHDAEAFVYYRKNGDTTYIREGNYEGVYVIEGAETGDTWVSANDRQITVEGTNETITTSTCTFTNTLKLNVKSETGVYQETIYLQPGVGVVFVDTDDADYTLHSYEIY